MRTYFLRHGDHVKIGTSQNVNARVRAIQVGLPLASELIKVSDIQEKEAHKKAGELTNRASGEWFILNRDLEEWILSLQESPQEPTIPPERSLSLRMPRIANERTITVRIRGALNDDIKAAAKTLGLGKSDIIRMALAREIPIIAKKFAINSDSL